MARPASRCRTSTPVWARRRARGSFGARPNRPSPSCSPPTGSSGPGDASATGIDPQEDVVEPAVELVVVLAHTRAADADRPLVVHGAGPAVGPVHGVVDAGWSRPRRLVGTSRKCQVESAIETVERTVSSSSPDRTTQLGSPSSLSTCSFHSPPSEANLPFCTMLDPVVVASGASHTLAPYSKSRSPGLSAASGKDLHHGARAAAGRRALRREGHRAAGPVGPRHHLDACRRWR